MAGFLSTLRYVCDCVMCVRVDSLRRVADDGASCLLNQENCDGAVAVEVSVKSNEFADERMVKLVKQSTIGTAPQMKLFIASTR
jgi:hypothetical protein